MQMPCRSFLKIPIAIFPTVSGDQGEEAAVVNEQGSGRYYSQDIL